MKNLLIGCSFLAVVAAAAPTWAQTAVSAPAAAPDKAGNDGIADIIVTASRREQSLQTTAIAVSAITSQEIVQRGIADVTDITKLLPAVKIGSVAGNGIQVTIRGVGNFGGNSYTEPGVAFNLDGAYIARNPGASGIFYDVNRVEVLKGPQGTLYGRNSNGGVVNILTNDPGKERGMNFTLEYGNTQHVRATGAVNIPIIDDVLSVRVAGQVVHSDGVTPDGALAENNRAGRIKIRFTPTTALSMMLEADVTKSHDGHLIGGFVVPGYNPFTDITGGPTSLENTVIPPFAPKIKTDSFNDNSSRGAQGTINYNFGPVTATAIVANRTNTAHYRHYGAGFPVTDDTRGAPSDYTTAEGRLTSNTAGRLKWQVGLFYFDDDNHTRIAFDQGVAYQLSDVHLKTKSISGFAEGTFSVTSAIRFTAGGRYTSDKKSIGGSTTSPVGAPGLGAPPPPPVIDAFLCPTASRISYNPGVAFAPESGTPFSAGSCTVPVAGQGKFNKFTYKVGVEADVARHSLLYATVATGFKAGGFFPGLTGPGPGGVTIRNSYEPETLTAYTIGSKNRFFDNKLQLNLEAYYWDYKNKQFTHLGPVLPVGVNIVVDNAGSAKIYGAELEGIFEPTKNDTFNFGVQYLHGTYKSLTYNATFAGPQPSTTCAFGPVTRGNPFSSAVVNCSGRPVTLSPKWVVNLGYHHRFDLGSHGGITVNAETQIQSKYYAGEEYLSDQLQSSTTVSDASVGWQTADGHLGVTAFVNSIEDDRVIASSFVYPFTGAVRQALRSPRTYGIRMNVNF